MHNKSIIFKTWLTAFVLIALFNDYAKAQITLSWEKSLQGPSDQQSWPNLMKVDYLGNVYTVGVYMGSVDLDPGSGTSTFASTGGYDIYLSKLDSNGSFLWGKSLGEIADDFVYSISIDDSCNLYLTGTFQNTIDVDPGIGVTNLTSTSGDNMFILKLDSLGNLVWGKHIESSSIVIPHGISVASNGNIYSTGTFIDTVDFDPGISTNFLYSSNSKTFILNLTNSGGFVWVKQIGGLGVPTGLCINSDVTGYIYSSGVFYGTVDFNPNAGVDTLNTAATYFNSYILKLDTAGNFVWVKKIESTNSSNLPFAISTDSGDNLILAGSFYGDADFDPNIGVNILTTSSNDNGFLLKLDEDGFFQWASIIAGGTSTSKSHSISIDSLDNIYVTGFFSNTADFDPGIGNYNLTSNGINDIYITKLSSSGGFLFAEGIGGSMDDQGSSIAISHFGVIYLGGYYNNTVDFDPSPSNASLTSAGWNDVFICKFYDGYNIGIENNPNDIQANIYPNPTSGIINIVSLPATVSVYNMAGEQVYVANNMEGISLHDLSILADGLYFLHLHSKNGSAIRKLIIAK